MAIALSADLYIPGHSPLHRWAIRPKLVSLLALMFAMAMVRQGVLVPGVVTIALGLYALAGLPWGYLGRRLPYPGLFIVALVVVLPFTAGETSLGQWGWLTLRLEGLHLAGLITGRFLGILITGFVLLGTTPFLDILGGLRALGLPPLLTDMALLTYRYLYDVTNQWAAMNQGMRLRGYGTQRHPTRRYWGWLAALWGSLLLRSYGRSQRVYQAMNLRGYGQGRGTALRHPQGNKAITVWATILTGVATVTLILAEIVLTEIALAEITLAHG